MDHGATGPEADRSMSSARRTLGALASSAVVVMFAIRFARIVRSGPLPSWDAAMRPENGSLVLSAVILLMAAAAIGFTRSAVLPQVIARGIAWYWLVSEAWVVLMGGLSADPIGDTAVLLVLALALLAWRPALHGSDARREFAPVAYRQVLLGGAVAAVSLACMIGLRALHLWQAALWEGGARLVALGATVTALASAFALAALGVLRMRAWGLLLGVATSAASVVFVLVGPQHLTAIFLSPGWPREIEALWGVIPGILLASPVLWSSRRAW